MLRFQSPCVVFSAIFQQITFHLMFQIDTFFVFIALFKAQVFFIVLLLQGLCKTLAKKSEFFKKKKSYIALAQCALLYTKCLCSKANTN